MDRIDALGADTRRLAAFRGQTIDSTLDDELQAIVAEAAALAGAPISLVSLVLRRTQFFRAQHGLPVDLARVLATDRTTSFCQFVVRDRAVFEVKDAELDTRIPQDLVKRYGIRSYLGTPLAVGNEIVGSLCVIDVKPRVFSEADRAALARLGERASRRLAELSLESADKAAHLMDQAARPAFLELRNLLGPITGYVSMARVAAMELQAFGRAQALMGASGSNRPRAVGAMEESAQALDDLSGMLAPLERLMGELASSILGIEPLVAHLDSETNVGEALIAASRLSHHVTKLVGGVRWKPVSETLHARSPRIAAVSVLATALAVFADHMKQGGLDSGVDGEVVELDRAIEIRLGSPGFSDSDASACSTAIRDLLDPVGWIGVTQAGDTVALTIAR